MSAPDLTSIRGVLSRATGTGWEAAYRQDVGVLLDECDTLRRMAEDAGRDENLNAGELEAARAEIAEERESVACCKAVIRETEIRLCGALGLDPDGDAASVLTVQEMAARAAAEIARLTAMIEQPGRAPNPAPVAKE